MANAAAVKGMDLSAVAASVKASGTRQAGKTEDGFQKLLDSKSGEESGRKETSDTKKTDDTKDTQKKPENDKVQEKPEKPEETLSPEDNAALEQAQAALLFQIVPQETEALGTEENQEQLLEIGALPAEETAEPEAVFGEVPDPDAKVSKPVEELPKEDAGEITQASKKEAEKAVLPTDTKEEKPEAKTSLEKPVKQASKNEAAGEKKPGQSLEQAAVNQQPETGTVEKTSVRTEIPKEYIRVQQPEEIPEKILDQLLVKTADGQKEFEVQLEPYDLGKIMIRVTFGKEAATVSIVCTEPKTMEMMAKNAREIGAIMEENLGSPTTIVVEDKEAGYLEQQKQGNGGNQGQQSEQESERQSKKDRESEGNDFLQQLRLGLI